MLLCLEFISPQNYRYIHRVAGVKRYIDSQSILFDIRVAEQKLREGERCHVGNTFLGVTATIYPDSGLNVSRPWIGDPIDKEEVASRIKSSLLSSV